MKLKYSALLLVAVASAAQAQYATKRPLRLSPAGVSPSPNVIDVPPMMAKAAGDTVFNEDFANGFAGNNGFGAWTTAEADGNWWVYSTTGPNGAYSVPAEAITGGTAANGFMIFQADSGNSDFSGGAPTALPSFTDWTGALVSPVIDLSATPYVRLEFRHKQRWCCGEVPQLLQVSNDGGATWTTDYNVVSEAANDDNGPFTTSVNISNAISANPAQARFRFLFNGGDQGTSHYHWQIDDVNIIEVFDFDMVIQGAKSHSFDLDLSATYDSLNYTVFPFAQLRALPMNMTVLNNGSATQDVTANFTVTQGGNPVLDQDQTITGFGAGTIQTVFADPDFTPPQVAGTYDISYSVETTNPDLVPGDNSASSSFAVDAYQYGRDGGVTSAFEDGDGAGGPYELCNIFATPNEADLYAVSVAIRSGTGTAGTVIRGSIRNVDADFSLIDNTEEYELTSADLNSATGTKFINLVFANPVTLDAAGAYMVCVEHFGGSTMRTGVNGTSDAQTSFIYFDPPGAQLEDWYFTTTTPMVRMNFDPAVGINEEAARELALRAVPTVFDEAATVRFQHEGGNASWSLIDITGRVLRSQDLGNMGAGVQSIDIDGTDLAQGQYMVRVVSNGVAASVKLVKAAN